MSSIIDVVTQSIHAIVVIPQPPFHPFLKFSDVAEHTHSLRHTYTDLNNLLVYTHVQCLSDC